MYSERELQPPTQEAEGNGSGPDVSTIRNPRFPVEHPDARVYLNVTDESGTATLDVDVIGVINGVRHLLASFTQATGVVQEQITIEGCPDVVSTDWLVGGTIVTMDWDIQITRL
jgi:hypothetical protein